MWLRNSTGFRLIWLDWFDLIFIFILILSNFDLILTIEYKILVCDSPVTILSKLSLYYLLEYNLAGTSRVSNNNFSKKRVWAGNTLRNFLFKIF